MKTTVEIPDALFRRAKSRAAERGTTLKALITEALREMLARDGATSREPAWMRGFGRLRRLSKETARIQARIDADLGKIEPEDRA